MPRQVRRVKTSIGGLTSTTANRRQNPSLRRASSPPVHPLMSAPARSSSERVSCAAIMPAPAPVASNAPAVRKGRAPPGAAVAPAGVEPTRSGAMLEGLRRSAVPAQPPRGGEVGLGVHIPPRGAAPASRWPRRRRAAAAESGPNRGRCRARRRRGQQRGAAAGGVGPTTAAPALAAARNAPARSAAARSAGGRRERRHPETAPPWRPHASAAFEPGRARRSGTGAARHARIGAALRVVGSTPAPRRRRARRDRAHRVRTVASAQRRRSAAPAAWPPPQPASPRPAGLTGTTHGASRAPAPAAIVRTRRPGAAAGGRPPSRYAWACRAPSRTSTEYARSGCCCSTTAPS